MFWFDCWQRWLSAVHYQGTTPTRASSMTTLGGPKKSDPNKVSWLIIKESCWITLAGLDQLCQLCQVCQSCEWSVEVLAIVCFGCSAVVASIQWVCFGKMMSGCHSAVGWINGLLAATSCDPGVWIGQCKAWVEGQSLASWSWWKVTITNVALHSSLAAVFDLSLIWSSCFVHFIGCRSHHRRWSRSSKRWMVTGVTRWKRCGSTGFQ